MRQLKSLDLNNAGLVTFHITNVRSVLTYASPVWFSLLSDFSKNELEKVQGLSYPIAVSKDVLRFQSFLLCMILLLALVKHVSLKFYITQSFFFKRFTFNNSRTSSRRPNAFRTAKAKTLAHTNSFFQSQMKHFNNFKIFLSRLFSLFM